MPVANPYFIKIELFWPDLTRPGPNEIARVQAYDFNGATVTWEGQSGFDPNTGGWQPVFMQNIPAFYPPREHPNLQFKVESTQEQVVHTTQVFQSIPSGSTVKIIIGESDEAGRREEEASRFPAPSLERAAGRSAPVRSKPST